jgi:nonribosomal peptide synthetase protein VioA
MIVVRTPMTANEQSVFAHHLLYPYSAAYLLQVRLELTGDLRVPVLRDTLAGLGRRHDTLASRYRHDDGYVRVIDPSLVPPITVHPVDTDPDAVARERGCTPIDLAEELPFRADIVPVGAERHELIITLHHIACDGASVPILLKSIEEGYNGGAAAADHAPPVLPALNRAGALARAKRFVGALPTIERLELPLDRSRGPEPTFAGACHQFLLTSELSRQVREFARRRRVTLFTVLTAAYAILLSRTAGQRQFLIGVPTDGRVDGEVEGLVGGFAGLVPLAIDYPDGVTIDELISRVRTQTARVLANSDLSYDAVLSAIGREPDRAPLISATIQLVDTPPTTVRLAGLRPAALPPSFWVRTDNGTAKFDLSLHLATSSTGDGVIHGAFEYAVDVLDDVTVQRWADRLVFVLGQLVAGNGDIDVVPPAERELMMAGFNDTAVGFGSGATLWELFRARSQADPAAAAVVSPGENVVWTYGELMARASAVASGLVRRGVGVGDRVGVGMDRCADLVAVLLGIAAAGAAYVPLDGASPAERRQFIIEDAGVGLVITRATVDGLVAEGTGIEVPASAGPDDLAYVIYTSGSSGRPKGVMVEHRGIVNYVRSMQHHFPLAPGEAVLQATALAFDVSAYEIFWPLSAGGRVVLLPEEQRGNLAAVAELLRTHAIVAMHLVPSLMRVLTEAVAPGTRFEAMRYAFVSGEMLDSELIRAASRLFPAGLINLYGATEVSVDSTYWQVADPEFDGTVLVGRPMANQTAYVVDERLRLAPIGSYGEIVLGGACVTRGYRNLTELTERSFVPDPFATGPARTIYRTGDIGRWTSDGQLELRGRRDTQIKLHGTRLELGEVEAVLAELPGVTGAVAVVHGTGPAARLVAYVTGKGDALVEEDIRIAAAGRLPASAVPERIVVLPDFPRLISGKVDRNALPPPADEGRPRPVAPLTPAEAAMAAEWAAVLGHAVESPEANFFREGGTSLDAVRLVGRLSAAFGARTGLSWVFQQQTVARMAAALPESGPAVNQGEPVDLTRLTRGEQRLWFLDQAIGAPSPYVMIVALELAGALDADRLAAAVEQVAAVHEGLSAAVSLADGEPRRVLGRHRIAVTVHDLPGASATEAVTRLGLGAIDPASDPMVRAVLVKPGAARVLLLLAVHHLVADGWALDLLLRQVHRRYQELGDPNPPALPPAPGIGPLLVAERAQQADGRWAADLDYWRRTLATAHPADLPTDRPRPAMPSGRGGLHTLIIDRGLRQELQRLADRSGTTLSTVLFAGVGLLVQRLTGADRTTLGTVVANRDDAGVQDVVGMCANTIAVPLSFTAGQRPEAAVRQVAERLVDAYAHVAAPLSAVVERIADDRDVRRNPLFDVMVLFRASDYSGALCPAGTTAREIPVDLAVAQFDLTFQFTDGPDGLQILVQYAAELFDHVTVERWVDRLLFALAQLADGVADVGVLPPAERDLVVAGFNDTATVFESGVTLWDLVCARATAESGAVAVVSLGEGVVWTYEELLSRARAVASGLAALGVRVGDRVGVRMERSAELVAVLLGITAAGAAYVPLDMEPAAERLDFMARDAGIGLVITGAGVDGLVAEGAGIEVPASAGPDDLAYVIYTSGSSGRPKGVMVEHQAIVNRLQWMIAEYGFGRHDAILQKTPYTFDVSVWEFFAPLIAGARLVVLPPGHHRDPELVLDAVTAAGVTVLHFVPSMLSAMLGCRRVRERTASVRLLVCSGEALPVSTAGRALDLIDAELVNLYGPTEAAVDVTAHPVTRAGVEAGIMRIGRPIANITAYVVDEHLAPVPIGVEGDLLLGGVGLARGYIGDPAQTARRFVADHLGPTPGRRLYHTGDRAAWAADGSLDYRGRADHQVKLRGLRIELGEIEHALVDLGLADQAAVTVRGEGESAYLVGYVVAGAEPDEARFRAALGTRLPGYMIPGVLVRVDALPMSANGKLDRRALPAPRLADDAAPETLTDRERTVADVWEKVIGRRPASPDATFFGLGGTSMALLRVSVALHDEFGVSVPLGVLLHRHTLGGMAAAVEAAAQRPALEQTSGSLSAPASPSQRRIWVESMIDGSGYRYNVPVGLRLRGPLEPSRLAHALDAVVERHPILRSTLHDEGELVVRVSADQRVRLRVEDLRGRSEAGVQALRTEFFTKCFVPGDGPLGAATLIRLGEDEHELLLCFHHAVVDAESLDIIVEDIASVYAGRSLGVEPEQSSYLAYCLRAAPPATPDVLAWWRSELTALTPFALPRTTDRSSAPPARSYSFAMGERLTEAATVVAQRRDGSLFLVVVTAWLMALAEAGGGEPVLAVQLSVRPPEFARTVGPFINQIPLRAGAGGTDDAAALFDRVAWRWREVAAHADVPFDAIVAACGAPLSREPAFTEVGFSFTDAISSRGWSDLDAAPADLDLPSQPKAPLFIEMERRAGGVRGVLEYRGDRHGSQQIARLHGSWEWAVRQLLMIGGADDR